MTIVFNRQVYTEHSTYFAEQAKELGYRYWYNHSWNTDINEETLPEDILFEADFFYKYGGGQTCISLVYPKGESLTHLAVNAGVASIEAAASSKEVLDEIVDFIQARIPTRKIEETKVDFNFWVQTANGPSKSSRKLIVPKWEEIRDNYDPITLEEIDYLTAIEDGDGLRDGRLILWRGEPGTGKTYAIRALAREWRKWCDFHFIVDPDEFFCRHADYMMKVILTGPTDRWKVLVLEDSGELLAADAKQQTGQGLSRLLNMVDGVLGQGIKLMVLITTNDELSKMHQAVVRNGRCVSRLAFELLAPEKANEWLAERGYKGDDLTRYHTVSELYALLRGEELKAEKRHIVGFV